MAFGGNQGFAGSVNWITFMYLALRGWQRVVAPGSECHEGRLQVVLIAWNGQSLLVWSGSTAQACRLCPGACIFWITTVANHGQC